MNFLTRPSSLCALLRLPAGAASAAASSCSLRSASVAIVTMAPLATVPSVRSIAISAALLKVKKLKQKHATSAKDVDGAIESIGNQELLERVQYDKLTAACQAELAKFQEALFRNLRLQITADALHDLEVSTGGHRVALGSLAEVYQKSSDTVVIDLAANRAALPDVRQALALKGFSGREQSEADCVFVSLPRVTTEQRRRLAGTGRELLNRAKLALKRLHDAGAKRLREAERAGSFSKDDLRACQQLLVALARRTNAQAEAAWSAKEKELLQGGGGGGEDAR